MRSSALKVGLLAITISVLPDKYSLSSSSVEGGRYSRYQMRSGHSLLLMILVRPKSQQAMPTTKKVIKYISGRTIILVNLGYMLKECSSSPMSKVFTHSQVAKKQPMEPSIMKMTSGE